MNIQKAILFTGAQNSYRMNKKEPQKSFTKLKFCDIILNSKGAKASEKEGEEDGYK